MATFSIDLAIVDIPVPVSIISPMRLEQLMSTLATPEVRSIPRVAVNFPLRLTLDIIGSIKDHRERDIFADVGVYTQHRRIPVTGIEEIKVNGPYFLYINHPEVPTLIDGIFAITHAIDQKCQRRDLYIVAADFGITLPWNEHLISVANDEYAKQHQAVGYRQSRQSTRDAIQNNLRGGHLVILAPEGKISPHNRLNGRESFRYGAGDVAVWATANDISQVPAAICVPRGKTEVHLGQPFFVSSTTGQDAVLEMMSRLNDLLPAEQRY